MLREYQDLTIHYGVFTVVSILSCMGLSLWEMTYG